MALSKCFTHSSGWKDTRVGASNSELMIVDIMVNLDIVYFL